MKRVCLFDFDGVLFDTVLEAYHVAYRTYFDKIDVDMGYYPLFEKYRYLIGPAWNFFPLFKAIEDDGKDVVELFNRYKMAGKDKNITIFEKKFFENREIIKKQDYDSWLKLNQPYSFALELQSKLNEGNNMLDLYIVTTKDRDTVYEILKSYNFDNFSYDNIYGKDEFAKFDSKREVILSILDKYDNFEAFFIDDLDIHLIDCENIENLKLYQADWGYIDRSKDGSYLISSDDMLKNI